MDREDPHFFLIAVKLDNQFFVADNYSNGVADVETGFFQPTAFDNDTGYITIG